MTIRYNTDDKTAWTEEFGRNLQNAIHASGYSQSEIAKKLGITEAMLSRYIHGISVPSVYKTCQLANVIGCDICDLI